MTSSVSTYNFRALQQLTEGYTVDELNAQLAVLQDNLRTVGAIMEIHNAGSSLLGFNATLDPNTKVGQPVYFDVEDQVFKPSKIVLVEQAGRLLAGPSSEAWGLLLDKCDATRGTLLFSGLGVVDLTESTGEAKPSGKWYLSTTEGELTEEPESMLVPVLLATGNGEVLFRPWFADTFPRYFPKTIQLSTAPAGTVANSGELYAFTATNAAVAGWLPATHAIFEGNRPAGAHLGYNWKNDGNLADIWPPVQPAECELLLDTGGSESKGYHVLPGNDNGRVLITEHGIWWMSPCRTHAPWNMVADGAANNSSCPKSYAKKMYLRADFARFIHLSGTSVNSLQSLIDWVKTYKRGTQTVATSGELDLVVDPTTLFAAAVDNGDTAIKGYSSGRFTRGPVTSSIIAGNSAVQLTGGTALAAVGGKIPRSGQVTISFNAAAIADLLPLATQFENSTTEAYGTTLGFGLRPGVLSSIVHTFHVNSAVTETTVQFHLWLLAPATMTLPPGMTLEIARCSPPSSGSVGSMTTYETIDFNYTPGQAMSPGDYVEALSDPVTVGGGDLLYLRLRRHGESDSVGSMLIVLHTFGQLAQS